MQSPIFESFYQDRGRSGSSDVCINLYPEHTDGPKGPEIGLLISVPGSNKSPFAGNVVFNRVRLFHDCHS